MNCIKSRSGRTGLSNDCPLLFPSLALVSDPIALRDGCMIWQMTARQRLGLDVRLHGALSAFWPRPRVQVKAQLNGRTTSWYFTCSQAMSRIAALSHHGLLVTVELFSPRYELHSPMPLVCIARECHVRNLVLKRYISYMRLCKAHCGLHWCP